MKNLFKVRRYKTSPKIKEEFVDFLKWTTIKHSANIRDLIHGAANGRTDEEFSKMVDSYFEEKDIALTGDIRKLHGANTRNATKELLIVISMIFLSVILTTILIYFFGDSFQNWLKK